MKIDFSDFQEAHNNYSSKGAYTANNWACVLDILEEHEWNPHEYLDYIYREFRKPMVPSLLGSATCVTAYEEAKEKRVLYNKERIKRLMHQFKVRLDMGTDLDAIFTDPELQGCSLLLFAFAKKLGEGLQDQIDAWRETAEYEYKVYPELIDIIIGYFGEGVMPYDS